MEIDLSKSLLDNLLSSCGHIAAHRIEKLFVVDGNTSWLQEGLKHELNVLHRCRFNFDNSTAELLQVYVGRMIQTSYRFKYLLQ